MNVTKTKVKAAVGVGALLLLGAGVYMLTRPKPPEHPEEEIGIYIDEATVQDPSGQRIVMPGDDIHVTVAFTNISEETVSPRMRLAIWDGTTPIEGEWIRCPLVAPGESAECDVSRDIPIATFWGPAWSPGWAVSVRLDVEGVKGAVRQWDSYFDIVGMASPEDIELIETTYFVA